MASVTYLGLFVDLVFLSLPSLLSVLFFSLVSPVAATDEDLPGSWVSPRVPVTDLALGPFVEGGSLDLDLSLLAAADDD